MMYRAIALFVIATAFVGIAARAQVMQSSSYKIESDSVNFGGARSGSASYSLEDTAGEVGTGDSSSASYKLSAGYLQTLENYLAITAPAADVTMSPSLGGLTGGTSNGSTAVTVTTDSAGGYQLMISASTSPAMASPGGDTIADYAPAGANPDYAFTVGTGDARFGFSPEGVDISSRFKDNGASCNTGSGDTSLACWDGLTTTPAEIAQRTSGNHPDGTATTIRFRVMLGANAAITEGTYTATTTITALSI